MIKKLFVFVIAIACGCSSSTSIVSSWKSPDVQPQDVELTKIMVAVLGNSEASRRIAEDKVASLNPKIHPSYQVLMNAAAATDTTRSSDILQEQGFDGIIVMKLVDKDKSTDWVPGSYTGYWSMHPYYWGGFGYGGYYDPGYYTEDITYVVETSLYSLKGSTRLLWSGISSTVNPSSVEKTVQDIAMKSYDQMKTDGLLPAESKK
ncbi:hypothetical protein [Echinicola vietnamensis]|uniref:DUF4136 domain-containing protein n=1 Tax=Echinicola vietnamensis (strain DSM 17526 / LMG 23754 / KMM 6221) TaxID=926556 RepID=L0G2Z4_ECHVK|nr:hypothetical protein [Echinicola vietnamensis]AGA79678.1 hypothetical protein Echvi_3462 [Echinicola vietnamensis DSM 17526]